MAEKQRNWDRITTLTWMLAALGLIAGAVCVAFLLLGPLTDLIANHDVQDLPLVQRAAHLQTARETVRTQLLTLGAGLFAVGALMFTARNFVLSRRTYALTEQGQVTDRFTRAIEQLGSDKLEVRLGSIYALERIARDSVRDHPAVMDVLCALLREPLPERSPADPADDGGKPRASADVQAAFSVLARRDAEQDQRVYVKSQGTWLFSVTHTLRIQTPLPLARANLAGVETFDADFSNANLDGANFAGADLELVDFSRAGLANANFTGANLDRANLKGAKIVDATFTHALLKDANLSKAMLSRADLTDADLSRADLTDANLTGAIFVGAHFDETIMDGADLSSAIWSPDGPVPDGWRRELIDSDVCRLQRAEPPAADAVAQVAQDVAVNEAHL